MLQDGLPEQAISAQPLKITLKRVCQELYAGQASEGDAGPWNCMKRMSLLMPSMVVCTMLSCTTTKPDCLQKASTKAALQGTATVQHPGGTGH